MVDVGVRQKHRGDRSGLHRQMAILLVGLFAPSLRQPAIEQVALAVHIQLMQGAGHYACRAPEGQFHLVRGYRSAVREKAPQPPVLCWLKV